MSTKADSVLSRYPQYEATIGIEVHVQLTTQTKIFCSCSNRIVPTPNTNICHICTGHPGTLPVLNKKVVEYAILTGLATHCTISPHSAFDRKHYFYPDLPKNYQITQNYLPICTEGYILIRLEDGSDKKVRIMRIHIEEDAGKNIHADKSNESFVDLNRTGTPLLEIVTYPDMVNAEEAKAYLKALRSIVQYLGICSGNMEEGAFRADTNVSVRKKGATTYGTRCELKNINSFKFISDAIEYELERHLTVIEEGGVIKQETRLWDGKKTVPMRSKEEAADYRFLADPDLPVIVADQSLIEKIRAQLPELPQQKFERFCTINGLTPYEATILIEDKELAYYYDEATKHTSSKQLKNWILRDLMAHLKEEKIPINQCRMTPEKLASLVNLVDQGIINNHTAKEVFDAVAQSGSNPLDIVKERGLEQMESAEELENIVKNIITANPSQAAEYRAGKDRLLGFFVGSVIKQTQGKGNPETIQHLVKKHLKDS